MPLGQGLTEVRDISEQSARLRGGRCLTFGMIVIGIPYLGDDYRYVKGI